MNTKELIEEYEESDEEFMDYFDMDDLYLYCKEYRERHKK